MGSLSISTDERARVAWASSLAAHSPAPRPGQLRSRLYTALAMCCTAIWSYNIGVAVLAVSRSLTRL
jgi:hypothetical protein